jgi:hypothetical protein
VVAGLGLVQAVAHQLQRESGGVVVAVDDTAVALVAGSFLQAVLVVVLPGDPGRAEGRGGIAAESLLDDMVALAVELERVGLIEERIALRVGHVDIIEAVEVVEGVGRGDFVRRAAGRLAIGVDDRRSRDCHPDHSRKSWSMERPKRPTPSRIAFGWCRRTNDHVRQV